MDVEFQTEELPDCNSLREEKIYEKIWRTRNAESMMLVQSGMIILATIVFGVMFYYHGMAADTSYGKPIQLTCRNYYWAETEKCGINGVKCGPFISDFSPIRCPSRCSWPDKTLKIWGSGIYRGDSRVCVAAVHAGLVSGTFGGCVLMRKTGGQLSFEGTSSNAITSLASQGWFPSSFAFKEIESNQISNCTEFGWGILVVLTFWIAGIFLLIRPSKLISYMWCFYLCFWYSVFVMVQSKDYQSSFIEATGTIFLVLSGSLYIYFTASSVSLLENEFGAPMNPFYPRLNPYINFLFFFLPMLFFVHQNLFPYFMADLDIDASFFQNATENISGIVTVIFFSAIFIIFLVYFIRQMYLLGKLGNYLKVYFIVGVVFLIICLLFQKSYSLHLHHSFIPLFLVPITSVSLDYGSLVAQGVFCGMFLNGITFYGWGFNFDPVSDGNGFSSPGTPNFNVSYQDAGNQFSLNMLPVTSFYFMNSSSRCSSQNCSAVVRIELIPIPTSFEASGYSLAFNKVEVYNGVGAVVWIKNLFPNVNYSVNLAYTYPWIGIGTSKPFHVSTYYSD